MISHAKQITSFTSDFVFLCLQSFSYLWKPGWPSLQSSLILEGLAGGCTPEFHLCTSSQNAVIQTHPWAAGALAQAPGLLVGASPRAPLPRGQQLLGPWRRWDPTAWYLGARACPEAFLPGRMAAFGQQLPARSPSPEDLCTHSFSWKGKEGCIILGRAYRLYLPRSTHFPGLPPPAPPLPSSFTLSGGFSIVCAFFLPPFFLVKTGLSLWMEKGSVFVECSCISKVLCWPVMNLPLLMWGNREILWLFFFFFPKLKLMLFLCQWYPRKCFVPFPPLSG